MTTNLSYLHRKAVIEVNAGHDEIIKIMNNYDNNVKFLTPKKKQKIRQLLTDIIENKKFLNEDYSWDSELLGKLI